MSAWESSAGQSDDWFTPKYVFDGLGCTFDLDVAAPKEGPRHVPASQWHWEKSLETVWSGFCWMNAPYGRRDGLRPWLKKFFEHGDGICLTPDRTSAPWFRDFAPLASHILFVPKIKFERPDGSIGKSPGTGSALMAAGKKAAKILATAKLNSVHVVPV